MLDHLFIYALIFIAGFSAYSAIQHCTHEHRWPQRRVHLLFAAIALLVSLFALINTLVFQATTVADYLVLVRVNMAIGLLLFALLPWFLAEYSDVRPKPALAGLSSLFALLLFVNLTQPYTVLHKEIHGLELLTLPWGERITLAQATPSTWSFITLAYVLLILAFAFYALAARFRRDRRRTTLVMISAVGMLLVTTGLFLLTTVEGLLVRLGIIHFIPLGVFGFLGMIIIMGVTLNREMQEEHKQAEEVLLENEEKYRELVETANSIILRMDTTGIVTFFNEYASQFLGFSQDEIIGRNVVGTIVPLTDSAGKDLAAMILDIGVHPEQYKNNQNENMCKDGTRVWVAWTNKPIMDENGRVKEILCIGNAITERKRAEEALQRSEEKFFKAFQASPNLMAIRSLRDGRFFDVNDAYIDVTGYSREELLSADSRRLGITDPENVERARQIINKQGFIRNWEGEFKTKTGDIHTGLFSAVVINIGDEPCLLSATQDITE